MHDAKEGFGRLPRILNRGPGRPSERLIAAFTECIPYSARDYPTAALHSEFMALRAIATREPGETGRLRRTIEKWSDAECEEMKGRLLDLAHRVIGA